jgi:hypothetical protein
MQADFFNAFERHFRDAELLFSNSRWANAYQLYGYSAECGIKCLMEKVFNMNLDELKEKPALEKDRKHLPVILDRYETYRTGPHAAEYLLPHTIPFDTWNVGARYAHESNFDQPFVELYKKGFSDVTTLILKAMEDGHIQ